MKKILWGLLGLGLTVAPAIQAAEITVSAAISLSPAFRAIGQAYQQQHPQDRVLFNFAGSGVLVQQLAQGAPVDVLATADEDSMNQAAALDLIVASSREDFAGNRLVLVQPQASTLPLRRLADLTTPAVQRIALGQPESVPAGRYARQVLQQAGLWIALQPRLIPAQNVRQALDYVARGEVEAGFVYATEARSAAPGVRVALTLPVHPPVRYPIALARRSLQPEAAARFVRFVQSRRGQQILVQAGFLPR